MKTIESIAKATVKLFEAVDFPSTVNLFRHGIYASGPRKLLERSTSYALRNFPDHPSKI